MSREMTVSELMVKMIDDSRGDLHDIGHFLKVYALAKTMGEQEGLPPEEQKALEMAAILHDIACPLCREKYGDTNGKHQEAEGAVLAEDFLKDAGLSGELRDRVVFLVGHHHTPQGADGPDYQLLLEADYLVNAEEAGYSPENIRNAGQRLFKSKTGRALLKSIYEAR